MQLINREKPSHFYLPTETGWQPYYEVPKKDGTGMRPTTIKDAREAGAVPSVTKILSQWAKPGLQNWKVQQYLMASFTLPRMEGEPLDTYAKRVIEDAEAQSEKAREFGSAIHAAAEEYAIDKTHAFEAPMLDYLGCYLLWFNKNVSKVLGVEQYVGSKELGYAGKLDLHVVLTSGEDAVVDLKTQGVKRDRKGEAKPAFYTEWLAQLAAYAYPLRDSDKWPVLLSVIVDSANPGPVHVKQWEYPESGWVIFEHFLGLWKTTEWLNQNGD